MLKTFEVVRRKMGIDDLTVRCAPALEGVYSWKLDW